MAIFEKRQLTKLFAKELEKRAVHDGSFSLSCGRRHLCDGERRKDGVSTTAQWTLPGGKKKAEQPRGTTPSSPGHQRSLQRILSEGEPLRSLNLDINPTSKPCNFILNALILDIFFRFFVSVSINLQYLSHSGHLNRTLW